MVTEQLSLGLVHAPPQMRARCRTCQRWVATTRDARLAEHGTDRRGRRRLPTPRPCPGSGAEIGLASRAVYACGWCGAARELLPPLGLVVVAYGSAPEGAAGPCCGCGTRTRRAEYAEPGPLCRVCYQPVHRHDPWYHQTAGIPIEAQP